MKVRGAWIDDPATQAVCAALVDRGYQALFVGGCVRNALLGVAVSDIDIATDATPEITTRCAQEAGLRAVPTGFEHGTVTVVSGGIAHEITTFRSDVTTDGRRAEVQFSTSVETDAARRDFTMNALYAKPDGTLIDPLGGLPDLQARRVRFIGSAAARIREDHLRSLRFFRFTAWYGDPALGIDAEGLAATAEHLDGLHILSRERVGAEMTKLLSAADPAMAVAAMRSAGVLNTVLEGADDRALAPLVHLEGQLGVMPDAIRRFSALADAHHAKALRLSKADSKRWALLRDALGGMKTAAHLGYLHGAEIALDIFLLRSAVLEQPMPPNVKQEADTGENAKFPVKARDLPELSGPALGAKLKELEQHWIASGFVLAKDDLLK